MGIFNEWIEKKYTESVSKKRIGSDPLRSALEKTVRGLQGGQLDYGYTGSGIRDSFGFDDIEMQKLKNLKIVVSNGFEEDYSIDQKMLSSIYQQLTGVPPKMPPKMPQRLPPPPARKPIQSTPTAPKTDSWGPNPFGDS